MPPGVMDGTAIGSEPQKGQGRVVIARNSPLPVA